ncbi:hypothetical protein ACJIZ3_024753 [Penstemon smallii]|uniref:Pseudouridine synthase I TruA alpha/beta domain-containing protein n=1 Tax=Penstemon smallii TaxID=265156 RepID=A0ABD3TTQ0_9LAMI
MKRIQTQSRLGFYHFPRSIPSYTWRRLKPQNPTLFTPSSQEENPYPKTQKMSTPTTSSDEENHENASNIPKYKRYKIAIFFAYCGVGYQGMQKNPGAKTIEGDLEEALFISGAVPEEDRGQPKRFDFARCARTDKGVSAVGQVVSGLFYVDPPCLIERLNSNLPPQIRIFGYKLTTPSFHAKKFCDKRRYIYLIPVFALDTSCHRDRESVMASLGSGDELVKCLACSERGRKVFGVMGKRDFESKVDSGISSNNGSALAENYDTRNNDSVNISRVETVNEFEEDKASSVDNGTLLDEKTIFADNGNVGLQKKNEFCYGDEVKERFNRILRYYEGKHNFHNFTTRMKAEDPAAKRHILSFNANTMVNVDGIEFIKCEVVGLSFMLHQIRKMIGLAVAIMRNYAPESLIETAFQQKVNINVPMAPEVGLYLEECFFSSYNQKCNDSLEELSMKDYDEEAEEFKMKYIYPHIASTEHKDGVVALWLHSLNYRNYPDLRFTDNVLISNLNGNEVVENGPSSELKDGGIVDMVS